MKKNFLYALIGALSLSVNLSAANVLESPDLSNPMHIVQTLDGFVEMECPLREIVRKPADSLRGNSQGTNPHIKIKESTSSNWSGYAAATSLTNPAKKVVTSVSGAWTVPALTSTPDHSYSSAWVGIDGYSSSTVEQIGTEHDWVDGAQQNYAWFEMYPSAGYEIQGFPVSQGDVIAGVVNYIGANTFQLILINYTEQVFTIIPTQYTVSSKAKRSSAEWIVEAPSLVSVLPLANFGTTTFMDCSATINGRTGSINNSHWRYDPLTMETPSHVTKATPSGLVSDGTGFTVTWAHE